MKNKSLLASVLILMVAASSAVSGQTTEITYQGQLQSSSATANGSFDFEFALFDGGGLQIGPTLPRSGVAVANGIFSVNLDFGSGFPGATRFLEIRVRPAGSGSFTTLSPRQPVTSSPYAIKSLTAENADAAVTAANATNAANAQNAVTFSGTLNGDVTGTQSATTVARLRGRDVSATQPSNGQVLKFNTVTGQWVPANDETATGGGGGGTITGVAAGTGLTGGGSTGNVTVGIANGGVSTNQLADNSVTDAKIVSVSGSKVTGTVANATNAVTATTATTATNATQLGGVPASQYLQTNGNGSVLTNLNASSITTGTLANARLGQIPTANIADGAVTSPKIAGGQVVKSITSGPSTLTDNVTLAAGANVTITPSGNTLTIAATGGSGGGVAGSGTPSTIPLWSNGTTLGDSAITQTGTVVQIAPTAQGNRITFGSPNGETGITIAGDTNRADIRFDQFGGLTLATGPAGGPPSGLNGIVIDRIGNVSMGSTDSAARLAVQTPQNISVSGVSGDPVGALSSTAENIGIYGFTQSGRGVVGEGVAGTGVSGRSQTGVAVEGIALNGDGVRGGSGTAMGVIGESTSGTGVYGVSQSYDGLRGNGPSGTGVRGMSTSGTAVQANCFGSGCISFKSTSGTSWFQGDSTPLTANAGSGTGVAIGSSGTGGYIFAYDYSVNTARHLFLNGPGGRVHIGTAFAGSPDQTLSVNGNASKVGGGSWAVLSDERLKNITGRFTGGLKAVMKLQPLRYSYKPDNEMKVVSDGEHIGFSAQAVERLVPEAVTKNDRGYRMVNNDPIVWTMLNAIKEQQAMIGDQQRQINQLKRLTCRKNKKAAICKGMK